MISGVRTFVVTAALVAAVGSAAAGFLPARAQAPAAAPSTGGEVDMAKGKALLQEACGGCHDAAQVEGEKHSRMGWEQVVDDMIGRGATLSDEQASLLVDYLAKAYPAQG